MDKNQKNRIATHALLTLDFLRDFTEEVERRPETKISDFFKGWQKKKSWTGPEGYLLVNSDIYLTLLYALLLLPAEKELAGIPEIPLKDLEGDWRDAKPRVVVWEEKTGKENDNTLRGLIYHIRNALAHARVEVSNGPEFTFSDRTKNGKEDNFKVVFKGHQLEAFWRKVGYCNVNDDWPKRVGG